MDKQRIGPTNAQHVVYHPGGGWSVLRNGARRATRTFRTRNDAITYGRGLARKAGVELVIHREDGTVASTNRYGVGARGDESGE